MNPTLAFGAGLLLAACHGAERAPFAPPDPFRPEVRPDLAGCEWIETSDLARLHADGGTYLTRTRYDALGRPVHTVANSEYDDGRFDRHTWTTEWEGGCPTDDTHDVESTLVGRLFVSSEWTRTRCDPHDNPTEVGLWGWSQEIGPDGTELAPMGYSEASRYETRYADGRPVEVIALDGDGAPRGEVVAYGWDGARLVFRRTEEPTNYGVHVVESTWDWDQERLVAGTVVDSYGPGSLSWENVFDADRWLGTDTSSQQGTSVTTLRWRYEGGAFPLGSRLVYPRLDLTYTSDVEVACD